MKYRIFAVLALLFMSSAVSGGAQTVVDRGFAHGYMLRFAKLNLIAKRNTAADHVFYHPATGEVIVGITRHPQRSGRNGEHTTPGDCWQSFNSGVKHATTFEVADSDGDHRQNDITLLGPDGRWVEITINIDDMPGCDATDAY